MHQEKGGKLKELTKFFSLLRFGSNFTPQSQRQLECEKKRMLQ